MLITSHLHGQFVTNGSATNAGGGCYQLTLDQPAQAGSVFSAAPINLAQPFSVSATFNFGCKDANGADGIVFVLATTNTALGGGGGMLGYNGIANSFAVEYDDWQNNNFNDPATDHVAIISNGSVNHGLPSNLVGPIPLPNIEDCNDHCFSASWNPATQSFTAVMDGSVITFNGNISAYLGGSNTAYYGFTSATGASTNPHKVCITSPQLVPMVDQSICPGQSIQLMADPNGDTYQWAPNPTLSSWSISNPVATPLVTTTYNVTITFACGGMATDDVIITVLPSPTATASNNSPICPGGTINLMASGGASYEWSGPPPFTSTQQNPSIPNADVFNSGLYTVTVTDANGCTGTASTNVIVLPPPVVAIVPPTFPLCEDSPVAQLSAVPGGGIWGGAANAAGQIDPMALGAGSHLVTYTYTDLNNCTGTDQIFITINPLPQVEIMPVPPLCENDFPFLMTADPSGGIWGGVAGPTGLVDPASLGTGMHEVTYTYIESTGCIGTDSYFLEVLPGANVVIQPAGPVCQNAPAFTMTAMPPGGTWGGAANAAGQINPAVLGPGMHNVTYSYSGQGLCPGMASAVVEIYDLPTANISGSGTICQGSGSTVDLTITASGAVPLEIIYAINNVAQNPITVPDGITTLPTGTPGTYTIVSVTDANGCQNNGTGSGLVEVVTAPMVTGFDTNCDTNNLNYTVTFEITGGEPSTYSVTGSVPGTLSPNPPYIFTSNPIASGIAYSFTINDGNNCAPILLSGNFSCQCVTDAGTMNLAPISVCVGDTVTATHNQDETLDGDDILVFVLHSSNGNSLGTVYATNSVPVFYLVPPMVPGTTYYISAVAGNANGNGGVDLNDPCLSVSFGTPVVFRPLPTATIGSNVAICEGEQATLTFTLTGNAPFDVVYSNGSQNFTLNNIFNGHTIQVSPSATTTYSLLSIGDNSSPACANTANSSVTVTVWPHVSTNETRAICQGDSLFLQGAFQHASGTYYDTLSTIHSCDSVIITLLSVNAVDSVFKNDSSCNPANVGTVVQVFTNVNGCDSVVVTTTIFSTTDTTQVNSTTCDPASVGIFTSNFITPDGCDSTVIETVSLLPSDTTHLFGSSCIPANVGTVTNVLTNQYGCDSLVIITTTFSQTDTTLINSTTCDPTQAGVFTNNYTTPDGCDSVVVETVALLPTDSTFLFDTSCDPNSAGVTVQNLSNQYGCDSTVVLTVTFSDADTTLLNSTTCDAGSAGVFITNLVAQDGCDSVVIETVELLPSIAIFLESDTCDPAGAGVFTYQLVNQYGCDSIVVLTVSLSPSDTTILALQTCDPLDTGTVVEVLSNQYGCDSTVVTITTLLLPSECGVSADLAGSTIPCGETEGALTLTVGLGEAPFSYAWSGPSSGTGTIASINTTEIISGLPPGSYTVTVTSASGFETIISSQILQLTPPNVQAQVTSDYNGFDISCSGESDGSVAATASGGQPPYTFLWSNNTTGAQQQNLPQGTYVVTVQDGNACTDETSVTLLEPLPLSLTFTVNDLSCFGVNDGIIYANASGGVAPYEYARAGGPFQSSEVFTGLAAGTYSITVRDANGCTVTEDIGVNVPVPVSVELGDDIMIEMGNSTTLHALVNVDPDSLSAIDWNTIVSENPDSLVQVVFPIITTTYTVSVTDENGCNDDDAVTVFVDRRKNVYVPNAFSPNGDGINDVFMIFAKPGQVKNIRSFLVFDRWGETVWEYYNFQPNNPAYGWDGHLRGEEMNPAVFAWFAEIEFIDGEVVLFEGDVALVK
ncbi:MAG: gliding motility-associated C-terminal domain-containing protein [Lewinellaceae bacterium]|nr:gliding motility-associated C-terminal domain-containing protein [Saprospiraceae bacterium]MCB9339980.1 gliding motility-associated C-terminal domain-containing protein [Lewinellaceae bacterium]